MKATRDLLSTIHDLAHARLRRDNARAALKTTPMDAPVFPRIIEESERAAAVLDVAIFKVISDAAEVQTTEDVEDAERTMQRRAADEESHYDSIRED